MSCCPYPIIQGRKLIYSFYSEANYLAKRRTEIILLYIMFFIGLGKVYKYLKINDLPLFLNLNCNGGLVKSPLSFIIAPRGFRDCFTILVLYLDVGMVLMQSPSVLKAMKSNLFITSKDF